MASLLRVLILGLFLSFSGGAEGSSQKESCLTSQQTRKHIELCHSDHPRPKADGPYQCGSPDQGFVLEDLLIAPLDEFDDCGRFRVDDFLDAGCVRNQTMDNQVAAKFDEAVFDLLEKVSGRSQIENDTVVDRIPFVTTSSSASSGQKEEKEDSSAFVSFKNLCKPVRPEVHDGQHNGVVNICGKGRATSTFVFLALNHADLDPVPPDYSFRCRCTLQPSDTLTLRVLDVRLQRSDSHDCSSGVTVKIHSKNQQKELSCQGHSALYGFDTLFSSPDEVTLDLTVSARAVAWPAALWIQASEDGSRTSWHPVIASCDGITRLDSLGRDDVDREEDDVDREEDDDTGPNMAVIGGAVAGGIVILAVIIIVLVIIKKRRRRNADGISDREKTDEVSYSLVNEYAEIDDSQSKFGLAKKPQTPPPPPLPDRLTSEASQVTNPSPDSTPPGSPPAINPVSKPPRTFSCGQDSGEGSDAISAAEEYDRLNLGEKSKMVSEGEVEGKEQVKGDDGKHGGSDRRRAAERYDHLKLEDRENDVEK